MILARQYTTVAARPAYPKTDLTETEPESLSLETIGSKGSLPRVSGLFWGMLAWLL